MHSCALNCRAMPAALQQVGSILLPVNNQTLFYFLTKSVLQVFTSGSILYLQGLSRQQREINLKH